MILARKQLTASLPTTISSLTMTEDAVMLSSIHTYTVNSDTDLGMIPVNTLLLDTGVVFSEVDLSNGHSLFSFYLRNILPACVE